MRLAKSHRTRYVWRGQANAKWPLYSSLYRRVCLTEGKRVDEDQLVGIETDILAELHRWGLHSPQNVGRLSILRQLAILQHYGSPTRLIDVTFNAFVAAWFACEEKWQNGAVDEANESADARLFAIDISNRLINENKNYRDWEDNFSRPWKNGSVKGWSNSVFAWKPSHLDSRIFAQNGAFLFGGVPTSQPQVPKEPVAGSNAWKVDEVRQACSVSLRPHKFNALKGGATNGAVFSFRISGKTKAKIREQLRMMFGYTHSTIYPDFTGFSQFGYPKLKNY